MHPHVVVAKSAQLRFRLRRKLRPLPCASSPHRAGRGGGPFRSCQKRNGPCTVQKKRPLRRAPARSCLRATGVGGSVQAPILACLRARYHLLRGRDCCPVADGADSVGVQGCIRPASLSARSAALRAAGFFAVAKREAAPCDNHPDEVGAIRHGTAATGIAEEHSVPEGQSKSEQAPIRRPPLRAEGHCTGARPSGLFFWTVHGPFSFRQDRKENGGCIAQLSS